MFELTKDFLIKEHYENKKSYSQIARETGIRRERISYYMNKWGFKNIRPDYAELLNFELLNLHYTILKKSAEQIAVEFNTNHSSVRYYLTKYNIPTNPYEMNKNRINGHKKRETGYMAIQGTWWRHFLILAKKRNKIVEITKEDVWNLYEKQDRKCKLSGVDIVFGLKSKNKKIEQTASIDRIDSGKHYTIDNIQLVHKKVNKIKQSLNQKEFLYWCKQITIHNNINL